MGSRKLILVVALQLVLEGCSVFSQFIQGPQTCSCVSSCPIIPAGQFVIPAIIKPILQPDVTVQNTAPTVSSYPGDFSGFGGFPSFPGGFSGGFPGPYGGGMPSIIFDDDDDDRSYNWLYFLILALSRRGRFGGGYGGFGGGYGGFGGGYGGYGDGYGGGYGNYGGCGGNNYGCSGCGCGCNNGFGYGGGYCNGNGGYGGFNGNNGGCGSGFTYFPYPIPVPCGSSTSGYPNYECPSDESYPNQGNQTPQRVEIKIQTENTPPST